MLLEIVLKPLCIEMNLSKVNKIVYPPIRCTVVDILLSVFITFVVIISSLKYSKTKDINASFR